MNRLSDLFVSSATKRASAEQNRMAFEQKKQQQQAFEQKMLQMGQQSEVELQAVNTLYLQIGQLHQSYFKELLIQCALELPEGKKIALLGIDIQEGFTNQYGGLPLRGENGRRAVVKAMAMYNAYLALVEEDLKYKDMFEIVTTQDAHRFNPSPYSPDSKTLRNAFGQATLNAQAKEMEPITPEQGKFGMHCIAGYDAGFHPRIKDIFETIQQKGKPIYNFGKIIFDATKAGFELVGFDIGNKKYRDENQPIYKKNGRKFSDYFVKEDFHKVLMFGLAQETGYCVGQAAHGLDALGVPVIVLDAGVACLYDELDKDSRLDSGACGTRDTSIDDYLVAGINYLVPDDTRLQSIPSEPIDPIVHAKKLQAAKYFYNETRLPLHYQDLFSKLDHVTFIKGSNLNAQAIKEQLNNYKKEFITDTSLELKARREKLASQMSAYFEAIKPQMVRDKYAEALFAALSVVVSFLTAGFFNRRYNLDKYSLFKTSQQRTQDAMDDMEVEANRVPSS